MRDTAKLDALEVRSLVRGLVRQRRVIYVSVAVFAAIGLCLNLFIPPVYRATVRMEVRRPLDRSPLTGQVLAAAGDKSENLSMLTAAEQITTKALLGRVANDFVAQGWIRSLPSPVNEQPELAWVARLLHVPMASASSRAVRDADYGGEQSLNGRIAWLRTVVKVDPVQDTRLVDLKVDHRNPDAALAIADRLAQLFVADQWRRAADADTSSLLQLRGQLEQMSSQFASARDDEAGSPARLAAVQDRIRQLTETVNQQNTDYLKAMSEYAAARARFDRVSADSTGSSAGEASALSAVQRQLQETRVQIATARATYGERHPKLLALQSQAEALQASLRHQQEQALDALKVEMDVSGEHARALKEQLDQSRSGLLTAERQAQRAGASESAIKTDRDLYSLMLARVQEGRMEGLMKTPPIQIVDAAMLAPHPVRPRRVLNLVVCLLTGLFLGAGLALLRDSIHRKISTPDDVEEQLGLPLLGVVPRAG